MSEKEKTLGQLRVKAEFNPEKNDLVSKIKDKSAELIDLYEELRTTGCTSEKHRVISIAQTELETSCMYGVKALFTK